MTLASAPSQLRHVLVIDDEADLRELLVITLGRMQLNATAVGSVKEARTLLEQHTFDLCLTDMNLPDGNGLELVELLGSAHRDTPVAVITAFGNMETATHAMKNGAYDFIAKPVTLKRLQQLITDGLAIGAAPTTAPAMTDDLVGDSLIMQRLRAQIAKLARSQAPVYISGESGSGKERVARLIHAQSARRTSPFVAINCGAIPSELMESEFFGHRKGSFTGAFEHRVGLFREANGGTLFLDEIADLPLNMQVKLLRVIQEKTVRPVGESQEFPINVRLLCATHKALANEVTDGRFRQDLYYRLNVIETHVAPLREHPEDIAPLLNAILTRLCHQWQIDVPLLANDVLPALRLYNFPGNVRELENILERAVTLSDGHIIEASHLQLDALSPTALAPATPAATAQQQRPPQQPLEHYLEAIEKQELLRALEATEWNRTAAAKQLGMTFRSLRYRLKKLRLGDDQP